MLCEKFCPTDQTKVSVVSYRPNKSFGCVLQTKQKFRLCPTDQTKVSVVSYRPNKSFGCVLQTKQKFRLCPTDQTKVSVVSYRPNKSFGCVLHTKRKFRKLFQMNSHFSVSIPQFWLTLDDVKGMTKGGFPLIAETAFSELAGTHKLTSNFLSLDECDNLVNIGLAGLSNRDS